MHMSAMFGGFISLLAIMFCKASQQENMFKINAGYRYNTSIFKTEITRSKLDCAMSCSYNSNCRSCDMKRCENGNVECQLSSSCSRTVSTLIRDEEYTYAYKLSIADVNECNSNPCQNGGTCNNDCDSYSCSCYVGYNGNNCQNTVIRPISSVGQSAYTSSPHWHNSYGPEKAVDGNKNPRMDNYGCFHSSVTVTEPLWWGVDLGRDMYVSSVHITNRRDCCADRLKEFRAYLSSDTVNPVNSTDKQLYAEMAGTYSAVHVDVPCDSSKYGRFLILSFDQRDTINFCEVNIDGFYEEDL